MCQLRDISQTLYKHPKLLFPHLHITPQQHTEGKAALSAHHSTTGRENETQSVAPQIEWQPDPLRTPQAAPPAFESSVELRADLSVVSALPGPPSTTVLCQCSVLASYPVSVYAPHCLREHTIAT
ncbi:hypothetical protein E2C01_018278 [Portunus trituberculatus]|uniref:Uncharacterized protein n=1 Tax=Portunus trituberculatus TaxID=210409 RepID=A0A5B7DV36_PORTR|nr:hypothetical protein [Portunus trituberculatus]